MKLSLYFMRHGQSLYQSCKIISGTNEFGLSGVGKMQSLQMAVQLSRVKFDQVYSSDLKRCMETLSLVYEKLAEKPSADQIHYTELLREKDAGEDKMKPYLDPSLSVKRQSDGRLKKTANGESWLDVSSRVQYFMNALVMTHIWEGKIQMDEQNKMLSSEKSELKLVMPQSQLQLGSNYHYSSKNTVRPKNVLIVTHCGFICELLIYLKHRKNKRLFEWVDIPENVSHESLSNQMHAKNGTIFQLDIIPDESGIGWECEVMARNGLQQSRIPFAGMRNYL